MRLKIILIRSLNMKGHQEAIMKKQQEAIIVLGGGIDPNGNLRQPSQCRVVCANKLFHEEVAPVIITSSKWSYQIRFIPARTIAAAMKAELIKLGVPEAKIILEDRSNDTISNIYCVKLILLSKNWTSITIVTSSFQYERVVYLCKKILGPDYQIDYAIAEDGLTDMELTRQMQVEKKLIDTTQQILEKYRDGDHQSIQGFLFENHHPYFNQNFEKNSIWSSKTLSPFHEDHRNISNDVKNDDFIVVQPKL
jgi:uncharacterized SAM-binding protein YcdF (DUF218 family)